MQFLRKIGPGKPRVFPHTAELAKRADMVVCDEKGNRLIETEPMEDLEEDVIVGDAPGATPMVNNEPDEPVGDGTAEGGDFVVGGEDPGNTDDTLPKPVDDLEAKKFPELRAIAKRMGVKQDQGETRASLIQKIREAS